MGQQAVPFRVGAARQRHPAAFELMDDGVPVLQLGEAYFVDVIGRAASLQFDRLRIPVGHRHFLGRLPERQVIGEEERRRPQPVAAVAPGQCQERDVLGHLLVGDAGGGVDDPLWSHQRGTAEQPDELHGPGRFVCPDTAFT